MEEHDQRELQLLLPPSTHLPCDVPKLSMGTDPSSRQLVDLNLSMSIGIGISQPPSDMESNNYTKRLQLIKQQTAEQIRLASVEKAYVERIRELTRREMELAEKDFARARLVWERAREEVEKVERMKEMATRRINTTCLEITCYSCHQRFRP